MRKIALSLLAVILAFSSTLANVASYPAGGGGQTGSYPSYWVSDGSLVITLDPSYTLGAISPASITMGGILDMDGNCIDLDANANTSICADTDDQIDIEVSGADDFQITANTFSALSGSSIDIADGALTGNSDMSAAGSANTLIATNTVTSGEFQALQARGRATAVGASTAETRGVYARATTNDNLYGGTVTALQTETIAKTGSTTVNLRGIFSAVDSEGTPSAITNLYGGYFRTKTSVAPATDFYGVVVENELFGGGVAADAGILLKGTGTFDHGLDMSGSTINTADFRGENSDTIANAADGVWTLAGVGGSNNEDITFDLESTANEVAIGSGSGVLDFNFGSIDLNTTGEGSFEHLISTDDLAVTDAITSASIDLGSTVVVVGTLDDDTMLTATNTTISTAESIKAYVDGGLTDTQVHGFVDNTETTIGFNDSTYVFTLTDAGADWSYYRDGIKYTISGNKTTTLAGSPPSTDKYYVYSDATDGTLTNSTTIWDLSSSKVPVAVIDWNDTLTPKYVLSDERHTSTWNKNLHESEHDTTGTKLESPSGAVSGYVVGSDVDANKQFDVAQTMIWDEDLEHTLAAITGGSDNYHIAYRTGASTWVWEQSAFPYDYTGAGYINYDNAGTMTQGQGNKYYTTYLLATNQTGLPKYVTIHGQSEFSNLATARNESFSDLTLTGFDTAEGVAIWKFIWDTSAGYSSTGKNELDVAPIPIETNITTAGAPSGLGTISTQDADDVVITGGTGAFNSLAVGINTTISGIMTWIASDNDQITATINTSDNLAFAGATGGYAFDTGMTIGGGANAHTITGSTVTGVLEVHSEGGANPAGLTIHNHNDSAATGTEMTMFRSRGTHASPTAVIDGTILGRFTGLGYDATDYNIGAQIAMVVDGTPGPNDIPTEIIFSTTADTAFSPTLAMSIGADQNLDLETNDIVNIGSIAPTTIELGHASDTTLARSGAGDITVEGNQIYRAGGTDVAVADGGTGLSAFTQYLITYADTTTSLAQIAIGTAGQVLTSAGAGAVSAFETLSVLVSELATGTDGELITWDSDGNPTTIAAGTLGYFLQAAGAGAEPTWSNALANGTTGTTQSMNDNSTKLATTAYADAASGATSVASLNTSFTVGETFAAGDWGYLKTSDGKIWKAEANAAASVYKPMRASGSGAAEASVAFDYMGLVTIGGITEGDDYYIQDNLEPLVIGDSGSGSMNFGFSTANWEKQAQSTTETPAEEIISITLELKKTGSPTDNMVMRIETDAAGDPSGSLVDANATVSFAGTSLTTSFVEHTLVFPDTISLSASTKYWIVFTRDSALSTSNYYHVASTGSSTYANGSSFKYESSSWTDNTEDLKITLNQLDISGKIGTSPGTNSKKVGTGWIDGKLLMTRTESN